MLAVCGSQHIYRLDHMRMAADQSVDSQVAKFLCDRFLLLRRSGLVFVAPVHIGDGVLGAFFFHGCERIFYFRIEGIQIIVVKGIDQRGNLLGQRNGINGNFAVLFCGFKYITDHADLNSVHIHYIVGLLLFVRAGAQITKISLL